MTWQSICITNGKRCFRLKDVAESIQILKNAARTRKVSAEEVLSALSVIEKVKLDPSKFLSTLGGAESPGRTWMLIFTAEVSISMLFFLPSFIFQVSYRVSET